MTDIGPARAFLDGVAYLMGAPNQRSHQVRVGPSQIGDPCDHCLGRAMAHMAFPMPFSPSSQTLPTWIGTAMHEKLERLISAHIGSLGMCLTEHRTVCGEITNYGRIVGSVDLYHIPTGTVVDWKGSSKEKIRGYKLNGSGQQYRVQRNLYGLGLVAEGYDVQSVANFYIPRDGFTLSEIYYEIEPFDADIALRALIRAQKIYQMVLDGELRELGSDPECWHCNQLSFGNVEIILPHNGVSSDETQDRPVDPILGA
jgi:hypothetical protein